jgi:hypothetical protein
MDENMKVMQIFWYKIPLLTFLNIVTFFLATSFHLFIIAIMLLRQFF